MPYHHFTREEQYVISHMAIVGFSLREIGRRIGRHPTRRPTRCSVRLYVVHFEVEFTLVQPGNPGPEPPAVYPELLDEGKHGLELGSPGPLQELVNHHLG
jgi:hypothetical protein